MKRFLCGLFRLIAWLAIFGGLLVFSEKNQWPGVALVAIGFSTLTVVTFISGRIRIYSQDDQTLVTADESPISFMVVLTILFFTSCALIVVTIVDLVRHLRAG